MFDDFQIKRITVCRVQISKRQSAKCSFYVGEKFLIKKRERTREMYGSIAVKLHYFAVTHTFEDSRDFLPR